MTRSPNCYIAEYTCIPGSVLPYFMSANFSCYTVAFFSLNWGISLRFLASCMQEVECDVWWFPGTPDPENPCYGYWDAKNTDPHTPIRFFGLSSVNRTVLDYYTFNVGPPPKSISLKLPNMGCSKECKPPQGKVQPLPSEQLAKGMVALPHFPSCG